MVKLKREQRKKDDKTLTVSKLCVITFFITFFLENAKTWVGRMTLNGQKQGIALGDKKIMPRPQTRALHQQVTGQN